MAIWNRIQRGKARELQEAYDRQNESRPDVVNPASPREMKEETHSIHFSTPASKAKKSRKVTVEDVTDDDEIEYLGRTSKHAKPRRESERRPAKPTGESRTERHTRATALSNLMEKQIDDVIGGRSKHRRGTSKLSSRKKIPSQYIRPAGPNRTYQSPRPCNERASSKLWRSHWG